ncbi:MAG TPA: phosphatidylinositol-specific phospholipase C/glycerophosphodiester phosphodiesterase family protein [Flavitalea sp.]|nr:phosphatidylinositol-specific phospholipase C/glycerophosphodiester phosphodiesterase family protein [Flavitalea sp.]
MKYVLLFFCFFSVNSLIAQPRAYTTANAHSHNDYEKPDPFYKAYKHQFGSIEADIFLLKESDDLFVAHNRSDLDKKRRTLDSLYLQPLANCIRKNNGFVYSDTSRKLQLLIDIKTEAIPTLNRLIEQLRKYPELINASTLKIVISGNRPPADMFIVYPPFIFFDGVVGTQYSNEALSRIPLFSGNFSAFSKWNGKGSMPENDRNELLKAISEVHLNAKPVRFWGAPDGNDAWIQFMSLQADYINTDRIEELSKFIETSQQKR